MMNVGNATYQGDNSVRKRDPTVPTALDYPQSLGEVDAKLTALQENASAGVIDNDTLEQYFPGFLATPQQNVIENVNYVDFYANEGQKERRMEFEIVPAPFQELIPNTARMIIKVGFKKTDGAVLDITESVPVNNFWGHYFKKLDIVRKIDGISIANSKQMEIAKSMFDDLVRLGEHNIELRSDLLFDPTPVCKKRQYTAADNAQKVQQIGDPNLVSRAARYGVRYVKEEEEYEIPLCFLHQFFLCEKIPPSASTQFKLIFDIETDTKKLFDSFTSVADQAAAVGRDPGKVVITGKPYIRINYRRNTTAYDQMFSQELMKNQAYTLLEFLDRSPLTYTLGSGDLSHQIKFPLQNFSPQFLVLDLYYQNDYLHLNSYTTHNSQYALKRIKSIKLSNLTQSNNTNVTLNYDLEKKSDRRQLHMNYLAFLKGFSQSVGHESLYSFSLGGITPPSFEKWNDDNAYGIVLDLRSSQGVTGRDEPLILQGEMILDIALRPNAQERNSESSILQCTFLHPSTYALVKNQDSPNISLVYTSNVNENIAYKA